MGTRIFTGFPGETFSFLRDLTDNNQKPWFDENRDRYDAYWKAPAYDLIDALAGPMAALPLPLKAEARINGSLRRINRDVRFSKDKSPYNPRLHLVFWAGSHPNRSPGYHFVLHADKIGFGAGAFGFDAAGLQSLRSRIVNPVSRAGLLEAIPQAEDIGCTFDKPDLVNLPKGYEADGGWEHLLRRKAFVMRTMKDQDLPEWIHTDQAVSEIIRQARALNPLLQWLSG